ncbi:TetR/AcrR family transcriptional regulator [Pseudomonas sp. PDNC002]|uniref:TetR/AcrR family transcriptional regulator n=1 Tax=Pseudomonas sp. PDNC002 TaxID=2811422 RepID=UPI001964C12C|nr:TetR/AcrR family transcriptional regulator [Pseudomonas sp. PDNC002]QRY77250.1 TetR/AcrR family transcriptional regulator [Pseudomonas sp. PDNC002]
METLNPVQRRIHQAALRLFAEKGANQVNISDLAQEAGVARGTIYNNLQSIDDLFHRVAGQLASEMHERVVKSFGDNADPALRLANGMRFFIRRAFEEPHWGAFINRFAMSDDSLRGMWFGPPMADLVSGVASGRYSIRGEQLPSAISMIAGTVLGSMFLVLEGHRTWRDAGSDAAELTLRALGVEAEEARRLASGELPPLPTLD